MQKLLNDYASIIGSPGLASDKFWVRTVFRDYYDIYCLLKAGCNLTEAVSYASYLSRHTIRSKSMYTKLLSPQLFRKDEDFQRMSPAEDISPEEIRDYIKAVMENEH